MAVIVFVCTGNICRSAMAEGIARDRLGAGTGLIFASAGTWPVLGPATPEAIAAAAEIGVDIGAHRAQALTAQLVHGADRLYGMTRRHVAAALDCGVANDRVSLLDPAAVEIDDPYGGTMDDYRTARAAVVAAIEARAEDWLRIAIE